MSRWAVFSPAIRLATYGAIVSSARSTAAIGMLIAGALVFN